MRKMKDSNSDRVAAFIARHLTRRIRYWVLISEGVRHIESDEVVPEVGFTEVLKRSGDAFRG